MFSGRQTDIILLIKGFTPVKQTFSRKLSLPVTA